ncbi:MAG TPA: hypothetical protein PKK69_02445, partial [Ferruginibacter sp.]|nr:hypothetical protein [Ferruginibacter sp.]
IKIDFPAVFLIGRFHGTGIQKSLLFRHVQQFVSATSTVGIGCGDAPFNSGARLISNEIKSKGGTGYELYHHH